MCVCVCGWMDGWIDGWLMAYRVHIDMVIRSGHEWGLRGAAWVDSNLFTDTLDYVDLNVTRAVQASQLPGVLGYHRRVFANREDDSYLIWDAVDAPLPDCARATYNLHVLTQLGWPGEVGCEHVASSAGTSATKLECAGLNEIKLDVTILQPANAVARNLVHLEADPLPVQFTGMTGSAGTIKKLQIPHRLFFK